VPISTRIIYFARGETIWRQSEYESERSHGFRTVSRGCLTLLRSPTLQRRGRGFLRAHTRADRMPCLRLLPSPGSEPHLVRQNSSLHARTAPIGLPSKGDTRRAGPRSGRPGREALWRVGGDAARPGVGQTKGDSGGAALPPSLAWGAQPHRMWSIIERERVRVFFFFFFFFYFFFRGGGC
jgi:hypothetical protein